MNESCTSRLLGAAAVSHSECVMRAERLWEAARTGLGRSPPAGVCRLTDSSALVYHTAAAAAATGRECWAGRSTPCLSTKALVSLSSQFRKIIVIATVILIARVNWPWFPLSPQQTVFTQQWLNEWKTIWTCTGTNEQNRINYNKFTIPLNISILYPHFRPV